VTYDRTESDASESFPYRPSRTARRRGLLTVVVSIGIACASLAVLPSGANVAVQSESEPEPEPSPPTDPSTSTTILEPCTTESDWGTAKAVGASKGQPPNEAVVLVTFVEECYESCLAEGWPCPMLRGRQPGPSTKTIDPPCPGGTIITNEPTLVSVGEPSPATVDVTSKWRCVFTSPEQSISPHQPPDPPPNFCGPWGPWVVGMRGGGVGHANDDPSRVYWRVVGFRVCRRTDPPAGGEPLHTYEKVFQGEIPTECRPAENPVLENAVQTESTFTVSTIVDCWKTEMLSID
jgi:hypothetical protein